MITQENFKFDVVMPHNNWSGVRRALETLRSKTPSNTIGKVIFIDQNPEYQKPVEIIQSQSQS
ncbi:MAG: hypothetical protein AABY22_03515, partial [Nanoarchaeota archaeon]